MPVELPAWTLPAVLIGSLLVFSFWEHFSPLRRRVEPRVRRVARRNRVFGVLTGVLGRFEWLSSAMRREPVQGGGG